MLPSRDLLRGRARGASLLGLALLASGAAALGCVEARERGPGGSQHGEGWKDKDSPNFHATYLAAHKAGIYECRACHGDDLQGGPSGVSCSAANCHDKPGGPEFCGTCHGTDTGPRPATGAHAKHIAYCDDCHKVPEFITSEGHFNGTVDVKFSLHAKLDGAQPTYDPTTKTCAGVYCHVDKKPKWETPPAGDTPCDFCHSAPPATHVRWAYVATVDTCKNCHDVPPGPTHIDGNPQIKPMACDACHGHGPSGAPPAGLAPKSPGLGAHQRHLDTTLPDRIGRAVACERCHHVPASVDAPGHLDTSAPADVFLQADESYDPATQTCVVACHFYKEGSPTWNAGAKAAACDGCHGFPPVYLANGTPHTVSEPTLEACLGCHTFDPDTHVNGLVDFKP
ncbi:MAG: hypothetical protein U0359_14605 [Byssovorax sp.]